ncbi:MAG: zinc ribbon domain-containing protein [Saprospiraceae bacterium]|nr:zinc ribbon domain-containing protein [Saprospiraceae bacterium]
MKKCHQCHNELPQNARFCLNCGAEQNMETAAPDPAYITVPSDKSVTRQFTEQFFLALKKRVQQEHQPDLFQAYSERVYETTFRDTIAELGAELEGQIHQRQQQGGLDLKKVNLHVHRLFENQLDYFIITFCADLNRVIIPPAILKYQSKRWNEINLYKMVMDYLDFEHEHEKPFTDFLNMPVEKLKNAGKSFLFPARKEKILFIVDTSLMGSGKEGFAMTEHALYWKFPLEKARLVNYERLEEIKRTENWLTINGLYFHVNTSLDLKMLKLLKRIKLLRKGI